MLKPIYDLSRILFGLAEHLREDRDEITEIRRDLRDLMLVVERLPSQITRAEQRERDMLMLRLENSILRGRLAGETDGGG